MSQSRIVPPRATQFLSLLTRIIKSTVSKMRTETSAQTQTWQFGEWVGIVLIRVISLVWQMGGDGEVKGSRGNVAATETWKPRDAWGIQEKRLGCVEKDLNATGKLERRVNGAVADDDGRWLGRSKQQHLSRQSTTNVWASAPENTRNNSGRVLSSLGCYHIRGRIIWQRVGGGRG